MDKQTFFRDLLTMAEAAYFVYNRFLGKMIEVLVDIGVDKYDVKEYEWRKKEGDLETVYELYHNNKLIAEASYLNLHGAPVLNDITTVIVDKSKTHEYFLKLISLGAEEFVNKAVILVPTVLISELSEIISIVDQIILEMLLNNAMKRGD